MLLQMEYESFSTTAELDTEESIICASPSEWSILIALEDSTFVVKADRQNFNS